MSEYYTTQDCAKTMEQMAACAQREYNMRKRVYPRWVEAGKMTAEKAKHEIECMESIWYVLFRLKELQDASEEMKAMEQKRQEQPTPKQDVLRI